MDGTSVNISGVNATISAEALAFLQSDIYNAGYGLVQIAMAVYGFAVYWYEKQERGTKSLPIQLLVSAFYYMGYFGINGGIFVANYLFDLKGGLLH